MTQPVGKITIYNLFDRDTVLHLRIPFSIFLLPIFIFGISQAATISLSGAFLLFIALHFFIYPASNAYNSYMDEDKGSIGGLEKPPPVTKRLYYASIIFDLSGLLLCFLVGWKIAALASIYILFSKIYSWKGIRLKKYALAGWATVMIFQGGYTFMLANMAASGDTGLDWFSIKNLECILFASLIIGGSYPLTQVYQHDEDSKRGDLTISYKLGIRGTFIFTGVFFTAGSLVAFHYFTTYYSLSQFLIFIACTLPLTGYFLNWFRITLADKSMADFKHTMLMNKLSSVCMMVCFGILLFLNHR